MKKDIRFRRNIIAHFLLFFILIFFLDMVRLPRAALVFGQSSGDLYQEFQSGNYEEAARLARNIISTSPASIEAHVVLGWSLLVVGNHTEALSIGQEALKLAPEDTRLLAIVGESHYYLGNWIEALPFLERYVSLAPTGSAIARVYFLMGEIFIRFGEYHHADIALATATYYDSSVAYWWYRRGFVFEQLEQIPQAVDSYRKALGLDPTLTEASESIERL